MEFRDGKVYFRCGNCGECWVDTTVRRQPAIQGLIAEYTSYYAGCHSCHKVSRAYHSSGLRRWPGVAEAARNLQYS